MRKVILCLPMLMAFYLLTGSFDAAKAADQYTLGTGQPGTGSHQLGVGLTLLIKVVVLPDEGIDLDLANDNPALDGNHLIINNPAQLTTLLADQPANAFRSIMSFRLQNAADDHPLELVARADVSADTIYTIMKTIFENGPFLNNVNEQVWDISVDQAVRDLQLPLHPGALRYYRDRGGLQQQVADGSTVGSRTISTSQSGSEFYGESTFFIYFDGQHARLDRAAQDQIAAACRYALHAESPLIQISGDPGEARNDASDGLADERIQSVIAALGQDAACGSDAPLVASNEGRATLPAKLLDASGDRVEITILLPQSRP